MFNLNSANCPMGNDDTVRCDGVNEKLGNLVVNGVIAFCDSSIYPLKPENPLVFLGKKSNQPDPNPIQGSKECEEMNDIKYYAVRCENANKRFRSERGKGVKGFINRELINAVTDVSLDIERGEVFGIIGPNGSGKSTLIRMLSTLLLPDSGNIRIFDMDVIEKPYEIRSIINRVSVDASFFKKLSVKENLSYAARLYGAPVLASLDKAREMLVRFGLEDKKMNQPVENLSRGQQQMVSIARSLLSTPNLLLLDEPTTGLDPKSKRQVQDFVKEINTDSGITVILTSHDMEEVEKLCGRIAFIRDGKIWAVGSSSELKEKADSVSLEDVFLKLTGEEFEDKAVA